MLRLYVRLIVIFAGSHVYCSTRGSKTQAVFISCPTRAYIIDNAEYANNLVNHLQTAFDKIQDKIHTAINCGHQAVFHGQSFNKATNDFTKDFKNFIKNGIEYHSAKKMYLYSKNYDEYTLFKLESIDSWKIAGCITLKKSEATSQWFSNYTQTPSSNITCKDHFANLKANKQLYSPFHGYPVVLIVPETLTRLMPQKHDGEIQPMYPTWGAALGGFFKHVVKESVVQVARDFGIKLRNESDPLFALQSSDFDNLILTMSAWGYTPGYGLYAPKFDPTDANNFHQIIEKIFNDNYGKKVVLVGYGSGGLLVRNYLLSTSEVWAKQYLQAFVSVATPFGGMTSTLRKLLPVNNGHLPRYDNSSHPESQAWLPILYTLPNANAFEMKNLLLGALSKNYTFAEQEALLRDLDLDFLIENYQEAQSMAQDIPKLDIQMYCLFGTSIRTDASYSYDHFLAFRNDQPSSVRKEDGDGVVTRRSAKGCLKWKGKNKVQQEVFTKTDHASIMQKEQFFSIMKNIVFASDKKN